MKKVYSLLLASLLTMSMFAQTKTIITAEKLWNHPIAQMTGVADARQGSGYNGTVYVADKGSHSVLAYSKVGDAVQKDTVVTNPAIYSTGIAVDDAGNIVLAAPDTSSAWYATPTRLLLVDKAAKTVDSIEISALGRTDFISATGNIKGAEGGYVYLYGNTAKALAVHFVNGAMESSATIETTATAGSGGQVVYTGTPDSYIAQVRASALQFNGREAVTLPGIYNSKLGLDVFTIAGKEVYAYNIGTAYNSLFKLYNATDSTFIPDMNGQTELFCVDASKAQSTSCANWLRASVIDANNVYVHQYCGSDGAALWKVSAVVAAEIVLSCDTLQGAVTGGGDIAVGANATVVATPKPGYEFVAWKKGGETVSTSASYTFAVSEGVALVAEFEAKANVTLTLAVNDATLGSITLPEGIVMGANSVVYGTPVTLTAVPAEGKTCIGWYKGDELYSTDYTITLNNKADLSLTAKFVNVLTLAYELNGGVTNDAGWTSKAHMALDLQMDYNAAYSASKAWAKADNGTIYYHVNGNWNLPEEVQGRAADITDFIQNVTYNTSNNMVNLLHTPKWLILMNYIDTLRVQGGFAVADEGALRADVSGFFLCSPAITDYRHTNDYTVAGTEAVFLFANKIAFANPTEIISEVTLNTPYKEGFTFDGWYANADFSGAKVTTVSPESNIPGNKLYAKWIEYIPTIAEALAADSAAQVKTGGIVTHIRGTKNVYIQDVTGGVLVYASSDATCHVGDKVVVRGKNVVYGGAPEIGGATIEVLESGQQLPAEATMTLAALVADPLAKFAQRVYVEAVTVSKYDKYHNLYVTDGTNEVECYYVTPDSASFPIGTRVNLHLIAAYFNGFQFEGPTSGVELTPLSGLDPFTYPALGDNNEYTLTNKWLYSNVMDNYSANKPAPDDYARGMVAKDGKMYFINRSTSSFTVVDGATGEMLDPIAITGDHLFQTPDPDSIGKYNSCATLAFNDVKLDQAGHFLIGGCVSGGNRVQIYKVDIATGAATNIIDERLYDNPDWGAELDSATTKWRFDAFNVYGDVDGNAVVMAADANSFYAYKWDITNGVAGAAERINCTPEPTDVSLIVKDGGLTVSAFGTAPQIFPVDFNYFYVDGWNTLPMLFDMDGTLMEDFATCPTGVHVPMMGADTMAMNMGHNGLCEFQIGNEYFLVMAATNTVGKPTSAFAIYKFADAAKSFAEMEPMWYFPKAGMGAATNGCRTAVPSVEVKDDIATIYIYTNNNGYGVYEMKGVLSGLNNVNGDANVQKVIKNGQVYIIKNGVEYTVLGVEVK